ncbi:MAG: hypothetical protein HYV63_01680 [Candidatus Schekmanbacteria bacterium]|nr:hypothetical protein [Candidatus Schekmanbacteria bacterium]
MRNVKMQSGTPRRMKGESGQSILEVLLVIMLVFIPVVLLLITYIIGNWNQTYAFSAARNDALERMVEPQLGWDDDENQPCVTLKTAKWIFFKPQGLAEFSSTVKLYQPHRPWPRTSVENCS